MLVIFTSKNILGRQTGANIIIYLLDHAHEAPLENIKVERKGGHKIKLLISDCVAQLVESYYKIKTNWLRYLS